MRLVTGDRLLKTPTSYFHPYVRYIVSDYELDELLNQSPSTQFRWSSLASFERRYGGQDLNGKKVVVYRHNAWGDQLMASAVPRYLKTLYPDAIVHLYCHPNVMPLWLGNEFVNGCAMPLPMHYDILKAYDYHIFYEGMLESNSEPDQRNCYDDMFSFIGLNDVPDQFKRPYIKPLPNDYEFFRSRGFTPASKYILVHLCPNNLNRAYPPGRTQELVLELGPTFPDHQIVLVGTGLNPEFESMVQTLTVSDLRDRIVSIVDQARSFRDLIPFVENAACVICPDSSIMHLAACFPSTPVISLWGLFDPQDRMRYYPNNLALSGPGCPHRPCRDHNFHLPTEQCKDAWKMPKEKIKWCHALASIEPEEIVINVKGVIR